MPSFRPAPLRRRLPPLRWTVEACGREPNASFEKSGGSCPRSATDGFDDGISSDDLRLARNSIDAFVLRHPRHFDRETRTMHKRNLLARTAIATLLSSLAFSSFAGQTGSYPVFINDGIRYAAGSMVAARYSADDVQRIECKSFAHISGQISATCYAKNAQGVTRSCFTTVPALVETARAASAESLISFRWNEDGDCEMIDIDNASRWKR